MIECVNICLTQSIFAYFSRIIYVKSIVIKTYSEPPCLSGVFKRSVMPKKPLITKGEDINLSTHHEIDQILGNPPSWILRWGITAVFLSVLIFGVIAWLIKYPDTIPAPISIVTENPAIKVVAPSSGKIISLLVANNQKIEAGSTIALLENPAQLKDIETLSTFIDDIDNYKNSSQFQNANPINNLVLGNIQPAYASLVQKINDFQYFSKRDGDQQKVTSLESQIQHTQNLSNNLRKQRQTILEVVALAQKDVTRKKNLLKSGAVSQLELEQSERNLLQTNRQQEDLDNQIIQNDMSVENFRTQIIDIKQGKSDGSSDRQLSIQQDIQRIKNELKIWKQTYLITAPISGTVSLFNIISEQQYININEELLTIVPSEGTGEIIGKAFLPMANSGKVKTGQVVNIRLNGFPFQEYGILKSTVKSISLVPVNINNQIDAYLLEIDLPNKLITTYDKEIAFRQEMQGTANIITEDRRVIDRIFDKIISLIKNN